jgi:hypothetical protein
VAVQRLSNSGRSGFSYKSLIAGITPLPSVPTIGAATAVNFESVNVAFTAPGAYAGSTYTATSSPGGFTGTSATSPILVSGLSELTEYTFTVTATNATGTSGASAASDPVTTPSGDNGVMFPLAMVQVGSAGASTISFTSIPSTYKHLQIRAIARSGNSNISSFLINVNSDTGSNYAWHYLYGDGATPVAGASASAGFIRVINLLGTGLANTFSAEVIDVLDYASTSKNKTFRMLGGGDRNGEGGIHLQSGAWFNTNAITSITFTPSDSYNFQQFSSFALYGIKGA